MAPNDCGSSACLVDRLGEQLAAQHKDGQRALKELINLHMEGVKEDSAELKKLVKENGDELFGRMRRVEDRLTVIETQLGPEGLDKKLRDIIEENADIKKFREWHNDWRNIKIAVIAAVAVALITGVLNAYSVIQNFKKQATYQGEQGIQGKQGLQGVQGIQGVQGR